MHKSCGWLFMSILAGACCIAAWGGPVEQLAPASAYASPEFRAAAADGQSVFATCATGAKVARVGLDGRMLGGWSLESRAVKGVRVNPTGVAAKGGFVYVTCGVQAGELQKFKEDGTFVAAAQAGQLQPLHRVPQPLKS